MTYLNSTDSTPEKQLNKREVVKRLREITPAKTREACFVCGRYKAITHLHHLVTVSEMADFIIRHSLYSVRVYLPTVWLCPNHHAILHAIYSNKSTDDKVDALRELSEGERMKYHEIEQLIDYNKLGEMLEANK